VNVLHAVSHTLIPATSQQTSCVTSLLTHAQAIYFSLWVQLKWSSEQDISRDRLTLWYLVGEPSVKLLLVHASTVILDFESRRDSMIKRFLFSQTCACLEVGPPLQQEEGFGYYWSLPLYWGWLEGALTHWLPPPPPTPTHKLIQTEAPTQFSPALLEFIQILYTSWACAS
jgi:hypothetical protein